MSRAKIEQMIETLTAAGVGVAVDLWLGGWSKSTHSSLPSLTFNLADDAEMSPFEAATVKKGKKVGQRYRAIFFEVGDDEEIIPTVAQIKAGEYAGRYAEEARALTESGFFLEEAVLAVLGSPEQYENWLRFRPCAGCGNPPPCDPAHVRSVARGAGTSIKPPYWIAPLCFTCHREIQHHKGICKLTKTEDVLQARETLDQWAADHLRLWGAQRLAEQLGQSALSHVAPEAVRAFTETHQIDPALLPA